MLKIYNSLQKQKQVFKPRIENEIKMYVCGPTVYDYCHIGNARSFAAFDVIVRYLRFSGYKVTYVRNITDIDDKIINKAKETQKTLHDISDFYTRAFQSDLASLNLLTPDHQPKATEYIPKIIDLIQRLIQKGFAYIASNGDVYYEVRKFQSYGCLSHRNIDQLESGARVEVVDVKKDPLDFVLWKLAKPGEPEWDSPWGKGRPGWHIECSAMSSDLLGDHFDIHGGGKDLVFPHHENEIAQSEAASGETFVNYWLHAGFLQIRKEKMSKSLGNFLTINELLKKYHPETLRFFLISSHYRSQLNFSEENLSQAHQSLSRLYTAIKDLPKTNPVADAKFENAFIEAMNDDFNTPIAFSVLFDLAHEIQRLRQVDIELAASYATLLKELGHVLGILVSDPNAFFQTSNATLETTQIEKLISDRNQARALKDWAEADRIRKELESQHIILEDGPNGTTWKVVG